jgi:DNA-directed DNA polymerase III PolC
MFIHLNTHSHFSFLEGVPSPAELAQAAARCGMPALGLTDRNSLTGAIEFYEACRGQGVQPVLGLELCFAQPEELGWAALGATSGAIPGGRLGEGGSSPSGNLTLLAQDMAGWGSLCRLRSALGLDPEAAAAGQLPFSALEANTAGLLCLCGGWRSLVDVWVSAGQAGPAHFYLERLEALFPGRLYVALQALPRRERDPLPGLVSLAESLGLPLVATHPVYYLTEEEAGIQRLMTAIRLNRPLRSLPAEASSPSGAAFLSPEEMERRFGRHPGALEAAAGIAGRCQLELPLGVHHYPEIHLPDGLRPIDQLRQKVVVGARRLYGEPAPGAAPDRKGETQEKGADSPPPSVELPEQVTERLEHELGVIEALGYTSLFLIMEEILGFARLRGVPISSRGSAASSLVAHCLGITSPDPLRLNLYFERFLNPARLTPPDIDTDLCSRRRDEVIRYVYQKYGEDRVAMVCTINRFRRRSALRETAKAHGLSPGEVKKLADSLPYRWGPPWLEGGGEAPFAELAEIYTAEPYPTIFREAKALLGLPHHLSIHPGGVVIAPGPLTDLAAVELAAKGVVVTGFDLEAVERLGLVKIDLLGIRGLTVLGDVAEALHRPAQKSGFQKSGAQESAYKEGGSQKSGSQKSGSPIEVLEAIPEEDPQVAELVRTGRTIGCFQIESPGMRATLKEIQAGSVDDLMVALALFRPGPLTGGLKSAFVRRHLKQETPTYLHPALQPLLADTYGVILYQEQVLRIAHELAGLSLVDADLLRRAMSHFDPGKEMQTLKEKFQSGAYTRRRVPEAVSERIWEQMAAFAGYGFPKAHAASYAQVAWRAAWCKVYAPAVFMAAVLANWGGYYGQRVYLTEARRMGLVLRPPDVNHAQPEFSVSFLDGKPALFMGLGQVRELTQRTMKRILRGRPFRSFDDFLARADPRRAEAENLVRAGALESLGPTPKLLRRLERGGWQGGQMPLFSLDEGREGEDWTLWEKVAAQEKVLGASISAHPLELYAGQIRAAGALNSLEAAARVGRLVLVAGMRQTWRRSRVDRGEPVYFMTFEDLEGMLDVTISAEVYRKSRRALEQEGPYLVQGVVEPGFATGEPFIRAEAVWLLEKEG